jgi:hypothetical protein
MLTKKSAEKNSYWQKQLSLMWPIKNSKFKLAIFISSLLLVVISVSVYSGMLIHKVGLAHFINESIRSRGMVIPNYFSSLLASPEHIDIDINFKNFQKLAFKREEALKIGRLVSDDADWVPARIRYGGQTYRVDLRLKGDRQTHWGKDEGWSFKIEVKDNKALMGMRRFAIQSPDTRDYLTEWYLYKLFGYFGLIDLRYNFIDVSINGSHQHIYAIEENFDKILIESNRYREGLILRFNTEPYWEGGRASWADKPGLLPVLLGTSIDAYQINKVLDNDNLAKQFYTAKNLMELFRQDKLSASQVFDIDKLAMFFAIIDLTGYHHACELDNLKFYYNPVTSLLEPIGYDNEQIIPLSVEGLSGEGKRIGDKITYSGYAEGTLKSRWYEQLFKDKEFFKKYINALGKISDEKVLDDFFVKTDAGYKENLRILHKSYPWYSFDKKTILYANQKYIKEFLTFRRRLHAYFDSFSKDKNLLAIHLCNIRSFPVEIIEVVYKDSVFFKPLNETIIQPFADSEPLTYLYIEFKPTGILSWSDEMSKELRLRYRILGASDIYEQPINPWQYLDNNFIKNDFIRQPENINSFPFLIVDKNARKILFKTGQWNLNKDLIIPKGYTVFAEGGLKLNLLNQATILSYSPIIFVGTQGNPVIISSSDSTAQGLTVVNCRQGSVLEYVIFENLSNPTKTGWELTGAVTFYEAPVAISQCRFLRNRSEDGLNIVRSEFNIVDTVFSHTASDAFDADFSKGRIYNSSFIDCGNDGIDVSGSVVELKDIFIDKAKDKGISVGESSRVKANSIEIKDSKLGIASKDMSELLLEKTRISGSEIGIAVYQKKPEFGPASIKATQLSIERTNLPYLVEEQSQLYVNGQSIKYDQNVVRGILESYSGL